MNILAKMRKTIITPFIQWINESSAHYNGIIVIGTFTLFILIILTFFIFKEREGIQSNPTTLLHFTTLVLILLIFGDLFFQGDLPWNITMIIKYNVIFLGGSFYLTFLAK